MSAGDTRNQMPEFPAVGPPVTFSPATPSGLKVKCDVCGVTGWGPATDDVDDAGPNVIVRWGPWQLICGGRGHLPCVDCGKMLRAKLDGTVRKHRVCPEQERELR